MSSITFYEAVRIACIQNKTSIKQLVTEMNASGIEGVYNYVYQVLKKQRNNNDIVVWFRNRLDIKESY